MRCAETRGGDRGGKINCNKTNMNRITLWNKRAARAAGVLWQSLRHSRDAMRNREEGEDEGACARPLLINKLAGLTTLVSTFDWEARGSDDVVSTTPNSFNLAHQFECNERGALEWRLLLFLFISFPLAYSFPPWQYLHRLSACERQTLNGTAPCRLTTIAVNWPILIHFIPLDSTVVIYFFYHYLSMKQITCIRHRNC